MQLRVHWERLYLEAIENEEEPSILLQLWETPGQTHEGTHARTHTCTHIYITHSASMSLSYCPKRKSKFLPPCCSPEFKGLRDLGTWWLERRSEEGKLQEFTKEVKKRPWEYIGQSWTSAKPLPSSVKGSRSCTTQKVSQVIDKLPTSPGWVVSPQKAQFQLMTQWSLQRQATVRYTVSSLGVAHSTAARHHLQREPIIKSWATLEVWEQGAVPGKGTSNCSPAAPGWGMAGWGIAESRRAQFRQAIGWDRKGGGFNREMVRKREPPPLMDRADLIKWE